MPSCARREVVAEGEVGVYHGISRCVRRAFLCGVDPLSGRSFEHRKPWIAARLEQLTAAFGVEVCSFAAMSNGLHVVLRNSPNLARQRSDEEVVRRWRPLPCRWASVPIATTCSSDWPGNCPADWTLPRAGVIFDVRCRPRGE